MLTVWSPLPLLRGWCLANKLPPGEPWRMFVPSALASPKTSSRMGNLRSSETCLNYARGLTASWVVPESWAAWPWRSQGSSWPPHFPGCWKNYTGPQPCSQVLLALSERPRRCPAGSLWEVSALTPAPQWTTWQRPVGHLAHGDFSELRKVFFSKSEFYVA